VNDYTSTIDLPAVAERLRDATGPVVLLTHAKPDGDALGSVLALSTALAALGHRTHPIVTPPVPANLRRLPGSDAVAVYDPNGEAPPPPGLLVVLDTGAYGQLGPLRGYVERYLGRTVIIDHHLSGDIPAPHRYIDTTAAACAEIVAELLAHLGPASAPAHGDDARRVIDTALFAGLASDTGWFRFSNVTPRTHRLAADLIARGVDHAGLYGLLEQNERPQKLLLLKRALASLELLADGRAALMVLRQSDFAETGAVEAETERLIDVPQQVGSVRVVALVTERTGDLGQPITAVSFRSKPEASAVDVSAVAGRFGGGGHARASGAKVMQAVDDVLPPVRDALVRAVGV
jgi:phosphoesterase RecJ-like protein